MTLLNNLNLDGVEYEFGGYATRFFTYDENTGYLTFTGANRYTFDNSIYSSGGAVLTGAVSSGGKLYTNDGKAGVMLLSTGSIHLQNNTGNSYIAFYGKDQTAYGANISYKVDNDYLYFANAARYYFYNTLITEGYFIANYGVYTGGKTSNSDGKTGAVLSQNGRLQLQNTEGNPYITFYGPNATDSEDAYISYNITNDYLVFGGATRYTFGQSIILSADAEGIFTGGKTAYNDGKSGVLINNKGRMYLTGTSDATSGLFFYPTTANASSGASIQYDPTEDYLNFVSATRYTFSARVDVDGAISSSSSLYLGNGTGYSSERYIYMPYADGSNHAIVYRASDGLTSYFGWTGSSSYASVGVLRGRTVKYSNSAGTTTLSDERLKKDFTTLDEWDTFFDTIEPCAFRMKGGNSGRFHMGFKAQQVEQALINCGKSTKDFAGFIRMPYRPDSDDPEGNELYEAVGIKPGDDEFGLVYTEFTALNTYQIQKLKARVKHLEELIEKLQV